MTGFKHFIRMLPLMLMVSIGNDIAITAFLNPHGINAGGATGLSTVVSVWTSIPFAIVYGIVNLPILYFGVRYLSLRYSVYSVFVTVVTTILFPYLQHFTVHTVPVISTGLGAVIYGISIGVTYRYNFSLGGFALLAKVLEVVTHKKIGSIFTVINFVPVILDACTTPRGPSLLWSIVFIVLTGEIINWTSMGKGYLIHNKTRLRKIVRFPIKANHSDEQQKQAS
ncbi:YitT family protein [Alicyclobacillus fastidiosus]|uniref:YitT family protein n=1 Tax=Alicyclobacillus fastidiosus TaxID=392011 RepID=A0ABY6ZDI5_9BACL|nr:YitT family protein [Alicyclobacillus fastidiosus]WAH40623.1 YitT family protein [Alicyclobacillus fastidiosus]